MSHLLVLVLVLVGLVTAGLEYNTALYVCKAGAFIPMSSSRLALTSAPLCSRRLSASTSSFSTAVTMDAYVTWPDDVIAARSLQSRLAAVRCRNNHATTERHHIHNGAIIVDIRLRSRSRAALWWLSLNIRRCVKSVLPHAESLFRVAYSCRVAIMWKRRTYNVSPVQDPAAVISNPIQCE